MTGCVREGDSHVNQTRPAAYLIHRRGFVRVEHEEAVHAEDNSWCDGMIAVR